MKYFIVDDTRVDWRLDKFLTEKTGQTRSQLKKAIESGLVLINDKQAKVHQFLRLKDKVTLLTTKSKLQTAKEEEEKEEINIEVPEPSIIKETDDYIIINKPAGLLVHATKSSNELTLVDWLIEKYPELEKIADPVSMTKRDLTFRPGIVHRLDREVSGIMLIARTQESFEFFKAQFKKRTIKKTYTAIVHGKMELGSGKIDFEISRSKTTKKMAAHPAGSGKGLTALTEYNVIRNDFKRSLLEINLHTGRTNQIRVHFNAINHPILGDRLYTQKRNSKNNETVARLMLHATKLSFTDQNGEKQNYQADIPAYFQKIIKLI